MKILVCISKTPETTAKIGFVNEHTTFDENGVSFIMNPYDEWYALVRALELKETHGGTVTVINVGNAGNDAVIRKGLAIGADDAVRVNMEVTNARTTASSIADYARDQNYDLILTGKETIDYNGAQVGGMIAELLDLPFISFASHLEYNDNKSIVTRDIEGGIEVAEIEGPLVLSAAKGLAEQRIPNMRGIMMAKRKPLVVIEPANTAVKESIVRYESPEAKSAVTLVDPDNMDELVRLLTEEAKII